MDLLDEIDEIAREQFHHGKGKVSLDSDDEELSLPQVSGTSITSKEELSTVNMPNFSIIDKIKNRINGVDEVRDIESEKSKTNQHSDDTQVVPLVSIPKDFTFNMSESILNVPSETQEIQKLPQLEIDEEEFTVPKVNSVPSQLTQVIQPYSTQLIDVSSDTQVIPPVETQVENGESLHNSTQVISQQSTQKITQVIPDRQTIETSSNQELFLQSDDEESTQPMTKEEREQRILQLAKQKKEERLAKEKQLEEELNRTTLTDDENDLNDFNDTVVSNINATDHTNIKELEQAEEFLNIQKRHRDIRPTYTKKNLFTKDKLIAAFDSDNDDEIMENTAKPVSSPTTSPIQETSKPEVASNDSSDDEEELNVLDLINQKPVKPLSTQAANPIELYAQKIKEKVNTNTNQFLLEDSDSDLEIEPKPPGSKFSNDAHELRKIPELLKEQRLLLQQKFVKRNFNKSKNSELPDSVKMLMLASSTNESHAKSLEMQKFLLKLKKNNIQQLQANKLADPDHELLVEMEKDEEVMGSLLEREMERARRIRKQEKLREKAKLALTGKLDDTNDDIPDSDFEVQESDYGSEEDSEGSNDDAEDSVEDEVENDDIENKVQSASDVPLAENSKRKDDTYMFEGRNSDSDCLLSDKEEGITASGSSNVASTVIDVKVKPVVTEQLFQNLEPRTTSWAAPEVLFDDTNTSTQDVNFTKLPSFQEESQTATQRDVSTQVDDPTQKDTEFDEDDDDVITPSAVRNGRRNVVLNRLEKLQEEEEEDEEAMKQKIKLYENKIRRKELQMRKRRRELERKGVKNVVEGEAVESEDEWHGLGGAEGELSEEANSEDEKMIDNNFNIDLKDEEIRKKFMEEYQIKDQAELERLLDDIKNHRLTKRAAANGLDIEFSDEEDELLMEYRRQKKAEQMQKLKDNKRLQGSVKNDKQKAFFELIEDKVSIIRIDSEDEEIENTNSEEEDDDDIEKEAPIRKKIKIEESFVQKQLSFLLDNEQDDYSRLQRTSKLQHGFDSSDEDVEDLHVLKSRSMASLASKKSESPSDNSQAKSNATETVDTDVDEDDEFMPSFKKPSLTKSFRSVSEQEKVQINEGKHFSGVTVNKQYKVALGSKASISYLSKNKSKKISVKTTREQRLERSLNMSKQNRSSLFKSTGFD